eukprot:3633583-Amphidinium_carterae.1
MESSLHRRQRRHRSHARLLLTLGKAASCLQLHHSANRYPSEFLAMRSKRWPCANPLCAGWEYADGRTTCRKCGAQCPAW